MPKKKKISPARLRKTKDRLRHIQYFYAIGGILILAAIGGAIYSPFSRTEVLSARAGQANSNADGGSVNVMMPESDMTSDTELYIEANGGKSREKAKPGEKDTAERREALRNRLGSKSGELRDKAEKKIKMRDKNGRDVDEREQRREAKRAEQMLEGIVSDEIVDAIESNDQNEELITVREEKGKNVYVVKGTKQQKFLGVIPVNITREVTVSEDTGNVTKTSSSFFGTLLDALSF